jgi:hypothetical protein
MLEVHIFVNGERVNEPIISDKSRMDGKRHDESERSPATMC